MAIHSVEIQNFKGISERTNVEIKPLTVFIGENSSGKSTVIHAIAALAQTVRLPNDSRPLILDDEFALIHLGRFIEVIHSASYQDAISLGVNIGRIPLRPFDPHLEPEELEVEVRYDFKSTKTTQDVYLHAGELKCGPRSFAIRRSRGRDYAVETQGAPRAVRTSLEAGFSLSERPMFGRRLAHIVEHYWTFGRAQRAVVKELTKVLYLGPFRQPPQRRYPTRGSSPREVGPQGEATIPLLANEAIQSRSRQHIRQIALWLDLLGVAKALDVKRVAASDLFDVIVTLNDSNKLPLADVGYGLSQVLPVLTQCSFAPDGATLLFEQPELHIHPLAQRPLARVFTEAIRSKNLHIVAETHSPELLQECILQLRAGNLRPDDFVAYRVKREEGRTQLDKVAVEQVQLEGGRLDFDLFYNWQRGFCSEV